MTFRKYEAYRISKLEIEILWNLNINLNIITYTNYISIIDEKHSNLLLVHCYPPHTNAQHLRMFPT